MNRSENNQEVEITMIALESFNFVFLYVRSLPVIKEYALLNILEYWLSEALSTSQMLLLMFKSCSEGQISKSLEDLKTPKDSRK